MNFIPMIPWLSESAEGPVGPGCQVIVQFDDPNDLHQALSNEIDWADKRPGHTVVCYQVLGAQRKYEHDHALYEIMAPAIKLLNTALPHLQRIDPTLMGRKERVQLDLMVLEVEEFLQLEMKK